MKLRLRCLESKETHRIEVPNTCNLQQLKEIIILQLFPSSSSSSISAVQHNLIFSLNRKEKLSGEESLQFLGVTSGDLIYYSRNPNAFSSQNPNLSHVELDNSQGISTKRDEVVNLVNTQKVKSVNLDELSVPSAGIRDMMDAQMEGSSKLRNPSDNSGNLGNSQMIESSKVDELIGSSAPFRESSGVNEEKSIDLVEETDEMEVDDEAEVEGNYRLSVPSFLKKVFVKEVGDASIGGEDHNLLVIAVHAVLLESGFVAYNPVSGTKGDGFHLTEAWPSKAFGTTLHYTLPDISASEVVDTVVLKFRALGKFVNVYGLLPKKGFGVHRVCLDEPRFLPALSSIWKKSDYTGSQNEIDGTRKLYPNQEIFEFWKMVKDRLSYPLLIDLCEQVGIVPPSCFMLLPTELKLKILESLPAIAVARVECLNSELRFLASNNDLWRLKYKEEFGYAPQSQREVQWKAKFCLDWEISKKRKRTCMQLRCREPPHPFFSSRRDPNFFGPNLRTFVNYGGYDRHPPLPPLRGDMIFRTNCDLGWL